VYERIVLDSFGKHLNIYFVTESEAMANHIFHHIGEVEELRKVKLKNSGFVTVADFGGHTSVSCRFALFSLALLLR